MTHYFNMQGLFACGCSRLDMPLDNLTFRVLLLCPSQILQGLFLLAQLVIDPAQGIQGPGIPAVCRGLSQLQGSFQLLLPGILALGQQVGQIVRSRQEVLLPVQDIFIVFPGFLQLSILLVQDP